MAAPHQSAITVERAFMSKGEKFIFFDDIPDSGEIGPMAEEGDAYEARVDCELVGLAVIDPLTSDPTHILRLAVTQDHRREGVGTALLEHLKRAHGSLFCRVRESNDASRQLVKSVGME